MEQFAIDVSRLFVLDPFKELMNRYASILVFEQVESSSHLPDFMLSHFTVYLEWFNFFARVFGRITLGGVVTIFEFESPLSHQLR